MAAALPPPPSWAMDRGCKYYSERSSTSIGSGTRFTDSQSICNSGSDAGISGVRSATGMRSKSMVNAREGREHQSI
jgi:hypothetical protein